ncbi:MAG: hypothetical protein JNM81_05635 [Rhodospirillaceae bacterium]|nr:hypothetical protein [Rhodospirillaceae bacterium]
MTLTQDAAAAALREIDAAQAQSRALFNYSKASPYLVLWGTLWVAVGVMTAASPANTGWFWLVADLIGFAACIYFIRRDRPKVSQPRTLATFRFVGIALVIAGFFAAVQALFGPATGTQTMALAALMVSAIYMGMGLWVGARYVAIGLLLLALTFVGVFVVPDQAVAFISVAGGLTLALGGLWMRRA